MTALPPLNHRSTSVHKQKPSVNNQSFLADSSNGLATPAAWRRVSVSLFRWCIVAKSLNGQSWMVLGVRITTIHRAQLLLFRGGHDPPMARDDSPEV